jgi:3'(2'), 5'-bisphosphate nucleotidase
MAQIEADLLEQVVEIARDAGRRILDIYERGFSVAAKDDGSPLTEADNAAHELIVARLQELTPDVPILSEESAGISFDERSRWTRFWLVDPLDGTKEFVNRRGDFTVNIAWVEHARPVLGVVYAPVSGAAYFAARGGGAFEQVGTCGRASIRAREYHGGKAIVAASRSHAGDHLGAFLAALEKREGAYESVSMGSALKLCLVAAGKADVYPRLGPTSEWDTAAAQCVVEEAGGRVINIAGNPLVYNKSSILNPWFLCCGAGDYDWASMLPPDARKAAGA